MNAENAPRASPILALVTLLAACGGKSFPMPPPQLLAPDPLADSVESVLFLIGDAGMATQETSPLLHRLRAEVDQWSKNIGREKSVVVLFLGDNVYPVGLRDESDPAFKVDSARLQSQLDVMDTDNGRKIGARAVFIAGNHDWGHMPGEKGRDRLDNQGRFIARRSRVGQFDADLLPRAGSASVGVVDVGKYIRLLLIDTAWWLLEANPAEKEYFAQQLDREMTNAHGRSVVIATHHPWSSGSAHGGLVPFWRTIGVKWLLSRAGASLQDLNSLPYRELKNKLTAMFAKHGPPMLWAGGHDHALQVIRNTAPTEPQWAIVSGAGSKISRVGPTDGSLFARSEPGYMRIAVMKSGEIDLFVVSASPEFLDCGAHPSATRAQCVEVGAQGFRTVYSNRLK